MEAVWIIYSFVPMTPVSLLTRHSDVTLDSALTPQEVAPQRLVPRHAGMVAASFYVGPLAHVRLCTKGGDRTIM